MCAEHQLWFHVDAAYGGAALCVPELRLRFAGIERADSLVIDPHKWLFAPLDCAAVLYRNPAAARRTHRQHAEYLEAFGDEHVNPSDLAFHLTRRRPRSAVLVRTRGAWDRRLRGFSPGRL